jgi:hypothetical protein
MASMIPAGPISSMSSVEKMEKPTSTSSMRSSKPESPEKKWKSKLNLGSKQKTEEERLKGRARKRTSKGDRGAEERRTGSDTGVDARSVADQALTSRLEEERAVGDLALRRPCSSVEGAVPAVQAGGVRVAREGTEGKQEDIRVEVSVEVDDRNRSVNLVEGAENGKDDGVVSAETDDLRVLLTVKSESFGAAEFCGMRG